VREWRIEVWSEQTGAWRLEANPPANSRKGAAAGRMPVASLSLHPFSLSSSLLSNLYSLISTL
jgi:hypothetical protein